jgi:aminoglycoside/choline kinase family phosphotransferase
MPGGASRRRFYRLDIGREIGSVVAMFVPDGAAPEEIQKDAGQARRWPFLEIRDLLAERGIRVPTILGEATDHNWLLVEDLGDDTIANFLLRQASQKRTVYRMAVRDLARAQRKLSELPEESIIRCRAFDEDLLRWEMDHFREWGLEARGIHLGAEDRAVFDSASDKLARRIASWPRGFVHRDYQSRNLMVVSGESEPMEIAWIDFQDALLGPRVYDLVALLSDSYQEFDAEFIAERLDEYVAHMGLPAGARSDVKREFDLVTVQRKLKDAGRFIFIDRTKNNRAFLPFVEPTIRKARAALERLSGDEDCEPLRRLLDRVIGRP